jgi:hypothetical protein
MRKLFLLNTEKQNVPLLCTAEKKQENHKTVQGFANKNSSQKSEHNTKYRKTSPANRQMQQNWHIPN